MTAHVESLIKNASNKKYDPRECEICGAVFVPTHGIQRTCPECREYARRGWHIGYRDVMPVESVKHREYVIRQRFEEAERNCTIVGEGYAERQIADSLKLAGKVKTEL